MNSIYASLLGWATGKGLRVDDPNRMIEEGDLLTNPPLIEAITELYNTLPETDLLRVQVMQDLLCLAKADPANNLTLLSLPSFHRWLLNSLMSSMPFGNTEMPLNTKLIWEIGCKLHASIMVSVIPTWSHSRLDEVMQWAEGKPRVKSQLLVRYVLGSVFEGLQDLTKKYQPDCNQPIWSNILHASFTVIQLIVGVGMRELDQDTKLDMLMYVNNKEILPKLSTKIII